MPKYFFTAKSQKGEPYSETREAGSERDLARSLRREGYVLISAIQEEEKKNYWKQILQEGISFGGVSLKDKMLLTRNLRVMISAGISIPKSLKTLSLQAKNKKLKNSLLEIAERVIRGENFSDSLLHYPKIFSKLFCNMVKVGEESGTLEKNLEILAMQIEREHALKEKIKEAMMYPAVIITAMCGIGVMMLIVVVPKLAQTFEELNAELPITTKIVIGLGTFLAEKWYFAVIIVFLLIFVFRMVLKVKIWKKAFDSIILSVPIISPIIKKTNAAHTVRTLSSLISAGVPLVRSLEIIAETLGNCHYREAIETAKEKVKKGEKLSQSLRPYENLYSLTVIQMIEVGEETGETSSILEKLGEFFEEEVSQATKNLTAVIEPILMLIIGGVVGFFAISMVQPMYSMLGALE